jgi:hypothetical protein
MRAPELSTRPTADQISRFRSLTTEERFDWLMNTLALCHDLATPATREAWSERKQAGSATALRYAWLYAKALDRSDYEGARGALSPDCRFSFRGREIIGPDAIVQIFVDNDRSARAQLDRIAFRSRLRLLEPGLVGVELVDELYKGDRRHLYRSEQHLTVRRGRIVVIEQIEREEERTKLAEFFASLGVAL